MLGRRSLLCGPLSAPFIVRTPGLLMRVRPLTIERDPTMDFNDPAAVSEWVDHKVQEALCSILGMPYCPSWTAVVYDE